MGDACCRWGGAALSTASGLEDEGAAAASRGDTAAGGRTGAEADRRLSRSSSSATPAVTSFIEPPAMPAVLAGARVDAATVDGGDCVRPPAMGARGGGDDAGNDGAAVDAITATGVDGGAPAAAARCGIPPVIKGAELAPSAITTEGPAFGGDSLRCRCPAPTPSDGDLQLEGCGCIGPEAGRGGTLCCCCCCCCACGAPCWPGCSCSSSRYSGSIPSSSCSGR